MKTLRIIIYYIIFTGYMNPVFPQSQQMVKDMVNAKCLMTYWHYRYRFLGDDEIPLLYPGFIQVGEGPGFSIPALWRNRCLNDEYWAYRLDTDDSIPGNQPGPCNNQGVEGTGREGILDWSDATNYLGYYIAVLATEWELLHRQSQNTAGTELELYNALLALERLDNAGEALYGLPPALNGFIIRDDVPMDFHQHFSADYELVTSGGSCDDQQAACFQGSGCDVHKDAPFLEPCFPYGSAPSIDQYTRILFGLRFVTKFIPTTVAVNGIILNVMAKNIATRILTHLRAGAATCNAQNPLNWLSGNINPNFNISWSLLDPNCELVCRGPFGQPFSYAFAESGKKITGDDFHDMFSVSAGLAIWDIIKAEAFLTPNGTIDLCLLPPPPIPLMLTILLTTGSICYGKDFDLGYNMNMILLLAVTSDTWNKNVLGAVAFNTDKAIYDLAGAVLNDYEPTAPADPLSYWENLLNQAPCRGPCWDVFDPSDLECHCPESSNTEWRYRFRWNNTNLDDAGEYNGLDYMLAFNLYRLAFYDELNWPAYIDITDRVIDVDFPLTLTQPFFTNPNAPALDVGDDANRLNVSAVSTLTVNSTVSQDGNVRFLAAKDVDITSESDFQSGSEVDVQVGFFDCQPNLFDLGNGSYIVSYKTSNTDAQNDSQSNGDSLKYPISQHERTKAAFEKEMFTIIPNPSTGKVTLTAPLKENETAMLFIENSLGRTVYKSSISRNSTLIDLLGYPQGIYMVKLAKEDRLFVKKLVLE